MSKESTADNLFEGGVESVETGSWGPFIKAVIGEYITAWMAAITPGESCTFVSNPDELMKCGYNEVKTEYGDQGVPGIGDDYKRCYANLIGIPANLDPGNTALSDKARLSHFSRGMGQEYEFPAPPNQPPCEQKGAFPNSCLYSFDAWNQLVDRAELRRIGADYSQQVVNDYWTGWKALTREERISRYRYNAQRCIDWAVAQGLSDEQRIALEAHFGGRWSGDVFRANHEVIDGRTVGSYAAWIPLGPNETALRRTYSRLYFDNGLTLEDMVRIGQMDRTEGLGASFKMLPVKKKREAMAQAYIIEAAKAGANSDKYEESVRRLQAEQEQDLGWEVTGRSPRDLQNPGFTMDGKPHTVTEWDKEAAADRLAKIARGGAPGIALRNVGQFAQTAGQAAKAAVSTPARAAVSGAVVLGLVGGGYWIWRKHGKKIKTQLRAKLKKLRRRR